MFNWLDIKYFMYIAFHVEQLSLGSFLRMTDYLPSSISSTVMSLGETPGIRLA